jgi:hypothetical protein
VIQRSRIDKKRIEKYGELWYKVSEPDHLGLSEVIEKIASLENYKSYEKMIINSSYGCYYSPDEPFVIVSENF